MEHLQFWLHKRLVPLRQYAGAYIATLPFGVVYLYLLSIGLSERAAMIVVVIPGLLAAYYVWTLIGKLQVVRSELTVRGEMLSLANTNTQYVPHDQFALSGALVVAVFVVCTAHTQLTYPSTLPVAVGSSDTQKV